MTTVDTSTLIADQAHHDHALIERVVARMATVTASEQADVDALRALLYGPYGRSRIACAIAVPSIMAWPVSDVRAMLRGIDAADAVVGALDGTPIAMGAHPDMLAIVADARMDGAP